MQNRKLFRRSPGTGAKRQANLAHPSGRSCIVQKGSVKRSRDRRKERREKARRRWPGPEMSAPSKVDETLEGADTTGVVRTTPTHLERKSRHERF